MPLSGRIVGVSEPDERWFERIPLVCAAPSAQPWGSKSKLKRGLIAMRSARSEDGWYYCRSERLNLSGREGGGAARQDLTVICLVFSV